MSDTYSVRITATDQASPVFRSMGAEAKKTDSILDNIGDGALKALQAIERNTAEAAESLRDFGKASQEAEQKSKSLSENLDKIGAGAGVLIGALSGLGQSYQTQERGITAVTRLYGENADAMLQYADYLQQTTVYSDDAARAALSLTGSLQNSYGFQADQIQNLVSIGADYASLYGLELPDAVERLTAAMRGEAEAAEALGLTLSDSQVAAYASSIGITNYSTGLDEAGRAQVRYQLLLEQSAVVQGTAGERAETLAGQTQQLMNRFQDAGQAVGGFIGPIGEVLSVLGPSALALPLVGAGLGKVAEGLRAVGTASSVSAAAGVGLARFLGPAGIVLAAAAGAYALYDYATATSEMETVQASATTTVAGLTIAIRDQAAAGNDVTWLEEQKNSLELLIGQQDRYVEYMKKPVSDDSIYLTDPSRTLTMRLADMERAYDRYALTADELASVQSNFNTILGYTGSNMDNVQTYLEEANYEYASGRIDAEAYANRLIYLSENLDNVGVSSADVAAEQTALNSIWAEGSQLVNAYAAAATRYFESQKEQGQTQVDIINDEIAASEARQQQYEDGGQAIEAAEERRLQVVLRNQAELAQSEEEFAANRQAVLDGRAAQNEQDRAYGEELNAHRREQADEERAIGEARVASAKQVADAYRSALGQTSDAPFLDGLDDMVAVGDLSEEQAGRIRSAFDALEASGASTLDIVVGLADAMGYAGTEAVGFAAGLYDAVDATDGVLGLYGAIDDLGNRLSSANTIASDLFGEGGDAFDGVGPLVDLLNNGTISQEQFNDAVAAGTQIQADNTRGQEALNAVRANLLPLLADQTTELANYYEELAKGSATEQQQALYLGDVANQQKVLNIEQAIYAASIGEIPAEAATRLIVDAAQADPILKQFLLDTGQIEEDPITGEIRVNFPDGESLPATITSLNDTLETLGSLLAEIAGVPDPFAETTAGADAATISTDGLTASTRALWAALGAPIPPPPPGANAGTQPREGIGFTDPDGNTGDGVRPGMQLPPFPAGAPITQPFPAPVPGAGAGPQTTQTVILDYIANTDSAMASVSGLELLTTGLTDGAHYIVVDSDVTQAGADLGRVQGQVRVLDESGATVYLGADDAQALQAMAHVDGQIRVIDEASGTVYVYGDASDASASITGIQTAHKELDGSRATLFADGDNSAALAAAFEAGSSFAGIDGVSALLFAKGDSSSAEAAASAAGAAIAGMDGTTGYVYAEGIDSYSGMVNNASFLDGVILATTYVDTIYREKKQFLDYFADGGVVGYADGGIVPAAAMGRVLVGENGPEIATLPGGTLITPSPASQQLAERMMGGGGLNVNVYMQGTYIGIDDFMGDIAAGINRAVDMQDASLGAA